MEERVFTYFVCLFFFTKYAQERVLSIAKRGRLTKVIPLKIFLDMVSTSSEDDTRVLLRCFRGGFVVSLCFKAKENPQCCWDAFFIEISNKQRRFYPSYVLKHFENLIGICPNNK